LNYSNWFELRIGLLIPDEAHPPKKHRDEKHEIDTVNTVSFHCIYSQVKAKSSLQLFDRIKKFRKFNLNLDKPWGRRN